MAKGNMFLGQARGSVGDVTFYVSNGKQVSRVRRRHIANPNSYAQLVQRAITSTIGRAYAAGRAIFDHSFEGKKVPSGSANRFRKVNADLLRQVVISELSASTPATECDAAVVQRGSVYPVPNAYRISEGSLVQTLFSIAPDSEDANLLQASIAAPVSAETVQGYLTRQGLSAGDIFTIVAFGITDSAWEQSGDDNPFTQFKCEFGFVRLIVKSSALSLTTAMSAATWEDIFEVEATNPLFVKSDLCVDGIDINEVVDSNNTVTGSMGVIRSEENQKLRSTSDMVLPSVSDWGIKPPYIQDAWDPEVQQLDSALILEGGNF